MLRLLLIAAAAAVWALPLHADTRCVQEFLSRTAFNPGPVDGLWGRKTAGALGAFLAQVGEDKRFSGKKNEVGKLCGLMKGERGEELRAKAKYRIYAVQLEHDDLPTSIVKTKYDFSKAAIDAELNESCMFSFHRKPKEDTRSKQMAFGRVAIDGGRLVFDDKHVWQTGGLADSSYLMDEANLAVEKGGKVVGKTPYFHLFISPGEIAEQPVYVELAFRFEPLGSREYPSGRSWFYVDSWQDAFFQLTC